MTKAEPVASPPSLTRVIEHMSVTQYGPMRVRSKTSRNSWEREFFFSARVLSWWECKPGVAGGHLSSRRGESDKTGVNT